jgi:RecA-family ATPase
LGDFLQRPSKEYLIDQVIGKGEIGMIFGPPGEGKTFAAIDQAISACLGEKWAGKFEIRKPLTVVYA